MSLFCIYCKMYLAHVRTAEFIVKGASLCGQHFSDFEDEKLVFSKDLFPNIIGQ